MTPLLPTDLRVSVASLVRVLFPHPQTDELVLALERKATVFGDAGQRRVRVFAQPFGGAAQFRDTTLLHNLIGEFQFDSDRSRLENDFRILIRPSDWPSVRQFCLQHLADENDPVLDSNPARELAEEFADALKIDLKPTQYTQRPVGVIVEDQPAPTDNPRALGYNTVRIYRIYEARLLDASLAQTINANSQHISNDDLRELALADLGSGGRGRANAVLALPLKNLTEAYLTLSPEARAASLTCYGHELDPSVLAALKDLPAPNYQRL